MSCFFSPNSPILPRNSPWQNRPGPRQVTLGEEEDCPWHLWERPRSCREGSPSWQIKKLPRIESFNIVEPCDHLGKMSWRTSLDLQGNKNQAPTWTSFSLYDFMICFFWETFNLIDLLAFMWFTLPNKVIKTSMIANCFIKYSQGKFASKHQTIHFFQCEWLKLGNNMCIQKINPLILANHFASPLITHHISSSIFPKKFSSTKRTCSAVTLASASLKAPCSRLPRRPCDSARRMSCAWLTERKHRAVSLSKDSMAHGHFCETSQTQKKTAE